MPETGWTLAGTDLRRVGYNIDSVSGWDGFPGFKGAPTEYGYRHGNRFDSRGFYRSRLLPLALRIFPVAPDGTTTYPGNPGRHIQENVDQLLGLLHSLGDITVSRAMPDGTTREIQGRAIQAVPIRGGQGAIDRNMGVLLECGYPFWQETTQQSVSNELTTFNAVNNGNAPINNMVITFNTPGRLTHDASGDYLETITDNNVVIDVGPRTVKIGSAFADNRLNDYNAAWFMQMEPGTNGFTVSGGGDVSMTWYHSWL